MYLVGLEDVVVGDLGVVDVAEAPMFKPVDGVTSPIPFVIDRIPVLSDQDRRHALKTKKYCK